MFDHSACARVRKAVDAHADVAALGMLAALLRPALSNRLGSSNAPLRRKRDAVLAGIGDEDPFGHGRQQQLRSAGQDPSRLAIGQGRL